MFFRVPAEALYPLGRGIYGSQGGCAQNLGQPRHGVGLQGQVVDHKGAVAADHHGLLGLNPRGELAVAAGHRDLTSDPT